MTALTPPPAVITPARRNGRLTVPLGWSDHRTRTVALNGWLAREDAVATGAAAAAEPSLLGLPDRDTLLRALFQRWSTTLEGVLDSILEDVNGPGEPTGGQAVRAAFHRAAAHRPADWRALVRESSDPVVAELTRRQHARIARRAGVRVAEVERIALATGVAVPSPSRRGRRGLSGRLFARRAAA